MTQVYKISVWNANDLTNHKNEVEVFLNIHNLDILLISETHFSFTSDFRMHNYITYHTNQPGADTQARGGTATLNILKILNLNTTFYKLLP